MTTTVYLLHFDKPLKHAQHYIGSSRDLEKRLNLHRSHRSRVKMIGAFLDQGSTFQLARTWVTEKAFALESHIKNSFKSARDLCPICTPGTTRGEFKEYME